MRTLLPNGHGIPWCLLADMKHDLHAGHAVQLKYVAKVLACTAARLTVGSVASQAPFIHLHVTHG